MVKKSEESSLDNGLKRLAKTSVFIFIGIFLSKIFGFVYRIIIAKYYGPEIYGVFTLSLMVLGIFVAFSSLGLNQGLIRFIPRHRAKNQKDEIRSLFQSSFKIVLITSFIAGIILFFFASFIAENIFHNLELIIFLKFFALAIPLTVILEIFLSLFISYERVATYTFLYKILVGFLKIFLLWIFIFLGLSYLSIIFSYLLAFVLILILTLLLCKLKFFRFIFGF